MAPERRIYTPIIDTGTLVLFFSTVASLHLHLCLVQMLIVEDSDNYDDFGENRSQFLFQIFKHMVLGGPVNQVRHKPVGQVQESLLMPPSCPSMRI